MTIDRKAFYPWWFEKINLRFQMVYYMQNMYNYSSSVTGIVCDTQTQEGQDKTVDCDGKDLTWHLRDTKVILKYMGVSNTAILG